MTKNIKRFKDLTFALNTSTSVYEQLNSEEGKLEELKDYMHKVCNQINIPGISLVSLKSSATKLIFHGHIPNWCTPGHYGLIKKFDEHLMLSLDEYTHKTIIDLLQSESEDEIDLNYFDVTLRLKDKVRTMTVDLDWLTKIIAIRHFGTYWSDENIRNLFGEYMPEFNKIYSKDNEVVVTVSNVPFGYYEKYAKLVSIFDIECIQDLAFLELVSIDKLYKHNPLGGGISIYYDYNYKDILEFKENTLEEVNLDRFNSDKDTLLKSLTEDFNHLLKNSYHEFITASILIRSSELSNIMNSVCDILLSYKNEFKEVKGTLSIKEYNLFWTYDSMYCKYCRKIGTIPRMGLESMDVLCPNCGKVHSQEDSASVFDKYYSNSKVFDHGEDEGKVRIRHRLVWYYTCPRKVIPMNTSLGFTVNLNTNRAYLHIKENNKNSIRCIGEKSLDCFESIVLATEGYSINSEGETVIKINAIEKSYNDLYESLSKYRDLKYSKKEILECSNSLGKFLRFSPVVGEDAQMEEKNKIYSILRACMFLCVLATDTTVDLEKIETKLACNTKLAGYVRSRNKKDGMYLKRRFPGMSNAIRKELIKNPYKIVSYMTFKDIIYDNNNLLKMLNFPITKRLLKDSVEYTSGSVKIDSFSNTELVINGFKERFKNLKNLYSSEKVFVNHALKYSIEDINRFLIDTLYILDKFNRNESRKHQDISIKFNRRFSLKRIHDEVSSAFNKLTRPNKVIGITENEETFSWDKGSYTFSPAKDTHELIDIGSELDICVGGYDSRALSKACTIFKVEKDDKLACCIELYPKNKYDSSSEVELIENRFKINQAKCYSNTLPQGELKSTILEWTKKNGIIMATSDLR